VIFEDDVLRERAEEGDLKTSVGLRLVSEPFSLRELFGHTNEQAAASSTVRVSGSSN
jgi:hypothetical protein